MTEYCSVCGKELSDTEIDMCDDCKVSILLTDDLDPSF